MPKKFNYKAPSIIALTLAGTALTTHHAHASEKTQDQTPNKNVLNDDNALKESEQIKGDVSKPTTNISGTQAYQDPTVIKEQDESNAQNYDAALDNLHNDSTNDESSNSQSTTDQTQVDNDSEQDSTTTDESKEAATQDDNVQTEQQTTDDKNTDQQENKAVDETTETSTNDSQTTSAKDDADTQNSADVNVQNYNVENNDTDATQFAQNNTSGDQSTNVTSNDDNDLTQPNTNGVNKDQQPTPKDEEADDSQALVATTSAVATKAEDTVQKPVAQQTTEKAEDSQAKQATTSAVATKDEDTVQKPDAQQTTDKAEDSKAKKATTSTVATKDEDTVQKPDAQQATEKAEDSQAKKATTSTVATKTEDAVQKPAAQQTTDKAEDSKAKEATTSAGTTKFRMAVATPKVRTLAATNTTQKATVKKEAATKATTSLPKYTPQVKSSINDYIRSKNYTVPKYEEDIASYLPQYSYRYGKPEGIVMHDTANDSSTITGEVNYMKNNYNAAFVHAYVDGNRVIETANTDYLAWGAGPAANDRFIHVELVHTHTADDFARSINNYADYAATNLLYYGLKPDSAEYDGQGTVWTHRAVSNYLGGTDHSDPHDYLQSHGYSYDELYDLINEKYLIKTGKVAAWGTTSSGSTGGNTGGSTGTTTPTGKLTVSNLTNTQGTVKSTNNGLYASVYDTTGKKNATINGKTYQLTKKATLGNKSFYLITDNKTNLGWMQTGDITVKKPATSSNSKLTVTSLKNTQGTVKSSNHGVYTTVYDKAGVKKSNINGKTYQLSKKATLGSKSFYLITDSKSKTNLGWLQTGDITVKAASTAKTKTATAPKPAAKPKVESTTKTTTNQTQNVSKIGQTNASKLGLKASVYDKTAKDGSKYAGKTFNVTKQRKQGNTTYVLIQNSTNGTPIGWVDTKNINTRNLSKAAAKKGNYVVKSTNSGLYAIPWGTKSQIIEPSKNLNNKSFTSSKSVFVDKDEYVYGTVNNKTGWIALKDLGVKAKTPVVKKPSTKAQPVDYTKAKKQNFDYVVYNKTGYFYNSPTSKTAGSLNQYYSTIFASYEKLVINGVTWYHGTLENGKKVWIKESDLRKELVKYISTGQTLNQAASKQYGLSFKPQVQRVPGTWQNATLSEIKNAMDTAVLSKDSTQKYQFLRLDKSQDISATNLNKLLQGKGILEGQGAAFKEAAKTYNINEVYLISHALLETGNGTSTLANGGDVINNKVNTKANTKYYNMFGIGAYDSDAVRQGFIRAKQEGWNTVRKAIIGGAKFIANSYIHQGQNTLYKMRWNPSNPGTHQYATDVNWAKHNATRIKGFYDSMGQVGKFFDVNTYI
ncbi:glucosaminidase domain-containing protein [Staphylococcus sp. 18_1_E_LY]|uniref:Bifunctional autolysin n=1 Tax=Staphylococcus lloydii TaxID=2781774 RepID=A0A7T1F974_9STAP|nr:glucosaminidase domain-containing protein [Staphylococcus lloydii]MBF7019046.1 glucosaminidase domain-containing protein [Staphylococcus lloydii]MBF7026774.1 glucosaminidase domain-containing protein [Staphylococcus lloydii]QPM74431.1 glucosaminidase domain-containing protein [Staphylococcus lloydii]